MAASALTDLTPFFDMVDATPSEHIGKFAFCVPNGRAFDRWPDYPNAARIESGRAASGRGLNWEDCLRSGLGEAVELASVCEWPDEKFLRAAVQDLGSQAIPPHCLVGHSLRQLRNRDLWNRSYFAKLDWIPQDLPTNHPIDWIPVTGIDARKVRYVPADLVFVGRKTPGDESAVGLATNSGCGAGDTPEKARMHALLEIIERDAIGTWWYGGRRSQQVEPSVLCEVSDIVQFVSENDRTTRFLDISSEVAIPVVAAISSRTDGTWVALGFSAKLSIAEAAHSAAIEMLQTEIALEQRARNNDATVAHWIRSANSRYAPLTETTSAEIASKSESILDLHRCIGEIERNGFEVYFCDLTRSAFDIPVFRAFVPGFCSDKPRWDCLSHRLGKIQKQNDDNHPQERPNSYLLV